MDILNKLVKGQLSLSVTFWGFSVFSCFVAFEIISIALMCSRSFFILDIVVIVVYSTKCVLVLMTLIGIFFILKNKVITVWGVIAFLITFVNFLFDCFTAALAISIYLSGDLDYYITFF